jgi:SAM-dependent methyltransferase
MMGRDEAIRTLRADPESADLVRDAYLGRDVAESADRFRRSTEFREVLRYLGDGLLGATVLDLGAGPGIASAAFLAAGAGRVLAVEPDPSDEVGRGAILRAGIPCEIIDAAGESLPLDDGSVDIVYGRQVLHHAQHLDRMVQEAARVLRPGGTFLACREHVVRDDRELQRFLADHPEHRLAGNEHAFRLDQYLTSMSRAGLQIVRVLRPWDTVINSFPQIDDPAQLQSLPSTLLVRKFPRIGKSLAAFPAARWVVRRRVETRIPGSMFSFLCRKPHG